MNGKRAKKIRRDAVDSVTAPNGMYDALAARRAYKLAKKQYHSRQLIKR